MMNVLINTGKLKNETRLSTVDKSDHSCVLHELTGKNETRFALMANLFLCEGIQGKVLKVYAKKRTGKKDFIATMQNALAKHYENQLVGKQFFTYLIFTKVL